MSDEPRFTDDERARFAAIRARVKDGASIDNRDAAFLIDGVVRLSKMLCEARWKLDAREHE